MAIFLFMNIIVALSAYWLTYKILRFTNFIDVLLSWSILYFCQIILTELALGIFGILYLNNVIFLNLAILIFIWSTTRNKKFSFSIIGLKEISAELLRNKVILLGTCLILGFGLVKIFINLINPPFGWDSLNYHFTFPVEWLKTANLDVPITINDDPSPSYYPINGSLIFLWLMLPLKNVFIADLGQVIFFIMALLAVYNISRKIGLNRQLAFYAAALFILIPNFFKQLEVAYVDIMVAGLFLACVNFLFMPDKKISCHNTFIFSLGVGLLIGIKTPGLLYAALLVIPFGYLLVKNIRKAHYLLIFVIMVFALGGFAYMRNFFSTGNPFYPLTVRLLSKTLFRGSMEAGVYRAHFISQDYRLSKILLHEGLGLQTILFILPGVFLAGPLAFLKRKKDFNFSLGYLLILPIPLYLIYRYIIPLANTRYLYPFLGMGMITGFFTVYTLGLPSKIINTLVVLCVLTSVIEIAKYGELVVTLSLVALLFLLLLFRPRPIVTLVRNRFGIGVFIVLVTLCLILLNINYNANEYSRYARSIKYSGFWPDAVQAWEWLNRNTNANNIAYVGRPVPFPLYGSQFKNNVYYVSVNKTEPAKLHYFPKSRYQWGYDFKGLHQNLEAQGNYRSDADYSVWLNNLFSRNTDYLFIYSLHQTEKIEFAVEEDWAENNPAHFNSVFRNDTIRIYKISK